jgi:transposase
MGEGEKIKKVVTLKNGRTRRLWTEQERREIIEETLKPGASVALIARAHDINANQLFKWCRLYGQSRPEVCASPALVPVQISDGVPLQAVSGRNNNRKTSGIIEIDLGHARVRIQGTADPECVKAALEGLR